MPPESLRGLIAVAYSVCYALIPTVAVIIKLLRGYRQAQRFTVEIVVV